MKHSFLFVAFAVSFLNPTFAQEQVTLEQAIGLALESGYDVRVARKLREAAETDNRYAPAAFLPQVNATAATTWNNSDQELRFNDASRNNSGEIASNNTNASLQLVWTLFDGTRMFATRERVAQLAEQGEILVKNEMVNTIASVITFYYGIVRQKQQLRAIHEQMAVNEERVKLAEKKLQVGTGTKPELLQARVDLNAQKAQLMQQETILSQLKEQLNGLVGLKLPPRFDVADSIVIDLTLDDPAKFENIENTNYQLQAARKNMGIAKLSLRERRSEYLPFLNFNAAYNFSKNDNTKQINPFGPIFNQTQGLNYGFSVTLPILNGFNTRRLTQQAVIEFDRQNLLFEQQRTNVNVALRTALVNYENAKKILLIEEETIGAAKENVSIALETFKRGVTTAIELRTAQQSLADAYNRLISARYNAKVAETELLRLNGSLLK
ncbi:MAG TPA: TolC family protein [Chryseosolibacter sp.]|nr:TolC family protein [Chryseosolibacter sp.]